MQAISIMKSAKAACTWADLIILCSGSYAAADQMLGLSSKPVSLQGRSVIYLCNGSPADAAAAAQQVMAAGATYLDGCLLVRSIFW